MTTPGISLTLFKNVFDNKTNKRIDLNDFKAFERFLFNLSKKSLQGKKDAHLISPAIYKENTTRANDNVTAWAGWCAVDVDDFEVNSNCLEEILIKKFGHLHFLCYSTASSTTSFPKFRLVFPLIRNILNKEIKSFWYALQSSLGDLGDKQTKDLSRMYYIPAEYTGAYNFIFKNEGEWLNPDTLMLQYPRPEQANLNSFFDRLPEPMQKEIIEHRKSKLENTNIQWSNYRDCPFWPKKLASEYNTISNTGWYHKMYQIMVAIAGNAIKKKYPISADEISVLCREFDTDTGNWYKNRPMNKEADRALEYVYRNT